MAATLAHPSANQIRDTGAANEFRQPTGVLMDAIDVIAQWQSLFCYHGADEDESDP
jgi:hypothetical protein